MTEVLTPKRVLLVPDVENWAWHKRARSLQKYAPSDIEVDIVMQRDFTPDMPNRYDGTLVFSWPDSPCCDDRCWTFVANEGVMHRYNPHSANFVERTASRMKNADTAANRIPQFRGVITINHRTVDFLKNLHPNAHRLPTGVDTSIFRQTRPVRSLPAYRIGWCGKSFDDKTKWTSKGYHEVLLPLMERFQGDGRFEWVINRRHAGDALSEPEMVEWFNNIDLLLITSCSEGTPSVLLEAMACGRGFISTPVGIARKCAILSSNQGHPSCGVCTEPWSDSDSAERVVNGLHKRLLCAIDEGIPSRVSAVARSTCHEYFGWESLAESWLRLILT